jgi:hypothetical protein
MWNSLVARGIFREAQEREASAWQFPLVAFCVVRAHLSAKKGRYYSWHRKAHCNLLKQQHLRINF